MRLVLGSLDRLVELVEDRGGRVPAKDAARHLFAISDAPECLALSLLRPLVDEDARLGLQGSDVVVEQARALAIPDASFVVFDLETTGLALPSARICEIGAVRIQALSPTATFETLVSPGVPLPGAIGRLTGLSEAELRRAPRIETAIGRFSAFAGDAVLVAHNARFDVGFVNRELARLTGHRLSATVIDTVPLARNLLRGRAQRANLASLAFFFGVSVEPCHRALPDAAATAEVFLCLVELARERGATSVGDLQELAAPASRKATGRGHGAGPRSSPARIP